MEVLTCHGICSKVILGVVGELENESDFAVYKKLRYIRYKALYLVNKAKTIFKDNLVEIKHGSKSEWQTLKSMGLPLKKTESSKSMGFKINGEICFDPLKQRWGQLLLKVIITITITLQFLHYHYNCTLFGNIILTITITLVM